MAVRLGSSLDLLWLISILVAAVSITLSSTYLLLSKASH